MSIWPVSPYSQTDDATLLQGCVDGDAGAVEALCQRYGWLIDLVSVRMLDETFPGQVESYDVLRAATDTYLRANHAAPLRVFAGRSLPHFIAAVTRRVAGDHLASPDHRRPLVATVLTPSSIQVLPSDETPLDDVGSVLERMPAVTTCVLRLRARGLERRQISAALAKPEQHVRETLEQLAQQLGRRLPNAVLTWRYILDAMATSERTDFAVRSLGDERFRRHRSETERAYRQLVDHVLAGPRTPLPMCLDHHLLARWLDGSLNEDDRPWAEGHVTGCAYCTDSLALLQLDMEAAGMMRPWRNEPRPLALAAANIASTRFLAGQTLAEASGGKAATLLQRIARVGRHLSSGRSESRPMTIPPPPIGVTRGVPSDEEAPVFAFEELARGRSPVAFTAIDEHLAKSALGARLRLLACAAGHDVPRAVGYAESLCERRAVDPMLFDDAQAVLLAPPDASLPREIVRERLGRLVPELVQHVMTPER